MSLNLAISKRLVHEEVKSFEYKIESTLSVKS